MDTKTSVSLALGTAFVGGAYGPCVRGVAVGVAMGLAAGPLMLSATPTPSLEGLIRGTLAGTLALHCGGELWNPPVRTGDWLTDLIAFVKRTAYYFVPLRPVVDPSRRTFWATIQRIAKASVWLVGKQVTGRVLAANLAASLAAGGDPRALHYALWAGNVLCNSITDVLEVAVPLITLGRYEVVPFNRNPLFSGSLGEFWGYRYNTLVHTLLKRNVSQPLAAMGCSRPAVVMGTFAASGLLHVAIVHAVFGTKLLPTMLYFLAHGALVVLEAALDLPRRAPLLARAYWLAAMAATMPLYPSVFIDHMPSMIENQLDPFGIPVLDDFVRWATVLPLPRGFLRQ